MIRSITQLLHYSKTDFPIIERILWQKFTVKYNQYIIHYTIQLIQDIQRPRIVGHY